MELDDGSFYSKKVIAIYSDPPRLRPPKKDQIKGFGEKTRFLSLRLQTTPYLQCTDTTIIVTDLSQ